MVKNNIFKVSGLILSAALIIPLFASAQSDTGLTTQIQSLMSQITSLEQQLHTLIQTSVGSSTSGWAIPLMASSTLPTTGGNGGNVPCPQFTRDLTVGSQGSDVSQLQSMLESDGFLSASSTGFFGQLTARALARFQGGMGLASSTGFFGPLTRNFLQGRCGGGNGDAGRNGTSTPPTWPGAHASSTPGSWGDSGGSSGIWRNPPATATSSEPCMQPYSPASDSAGSGSVHTNIEIMRPCGTGGTPPHIGPFWNGSTTSETPCPQSSIQNGSNVAAIAAALFVSHTILPGMDGNPCPNGSGVSGSSGSGQTGSGN